MVIAAGIERADDLARVAVLPQHPLFDGFVDCRRGETVVGRVLGLEFVLERLILFVLLPHHGFEVGEVHVFGQVEPERAHVDVLDGVQFVLQDGVQPSAQVVRFVVGEPVRPDLLLGEHVGDRYRHRLGSHLERRFVPRVPRDDDAVLIDDDRLLPAELLDAGPHRRHGGIVVSGIVFVGRHTPDVPFLYSHLYQLLPFWKLFTIDSRPPPSSRCAIPRRRRPSARLWRCT